MILKIVPKAGYNMCSGALEKVDKLQRKKAETEILVRLSEQS